MSDLKAQLEIPADASGVEAGVSKAKKSLSSLGVTAEAAGKRAADGIDKIGEGGDKAATKVDRSTKSLIGSIQRTTAALDAGSRSSSEYFRVLAAQRGIDTTALKPYLDQLDAVVGKSTKAAKAATDLSKITTSRGATGFQKSLEGVSTSLGATAFREIEEQVNKVPAAAKAAAAAAAPAIAQIGMSAKQTANALRGVPAQFTDIVVALQAGQNPLTVFLQQGGQLKDMFGGLGPAARALGGYVAGLINPFTLAAAAVAALGLAYFQGSKEADAFAKAIIFSGNVAGVTVGQLTAMAQRISAITGTQASASAALAEFAANGKIANSSLERFTVIALKLERETGQAVKETVKQFAELGREPVAASIKLNEQTGFLTTSLYRQIKALEDQGRVTEAASLAQKSYADAAENGLRRVENQLGSIESAWRSVTGFAKKAWDAMLNIGRPDTLQSQLATAQKTLTDLQARGPLAARGGKRQSTTNAEIEAQKQLIANLSEQLRLEGRVADSQKSAADQVQARIRFDKDGEQFMTNAAKLEKEITRARVEGAAAGATQAEIEKRIADIRAKYTDKSASKAALQIDKAQLNLDVEAIRNASEQLIGLYVNSERILESVRSAGLLGDKEYYEAKRAFIRLEIEAKEDALRKEIERFQQEKLSGKDRLDNERKIAEANSKLIVLRADASARLTILANQEEAAANRIRVGLLSARQAAQDYFDTINRQQSRELEGVGQGNRQRNFNAGVSQIEDRYASQRRDLENQKAQLELEGKFTDEARKQYEARLELIREFQTKSLQSYTEYYAKLTDKQTSFGVGASEAFNNYLDDAKNVAKQTEDAFTHAFQEMEDALVKFAQTGKLDFKSMLDSISADIIRSGIKGQLAKLFEFTKGGGLGETIAGLFGGGAKTTGDFSRMDRGQSGGGFANLIGTVASLFGGRAIGGPVSAGRMYQVNEKKQPELLNVDGKQFLMMGSQGGTVTPNGGSAQAPGVIHLTVNVPETTSRTSATQIAARTGAAVNRALAMKR